MNNKFNLKSIIIFIILQLIIITIVVEHNNVLADGKGTTWALKDNDEKSTVNNLEGFTRILSTLLVVIALIIAAIFVLKKKYGIKTNMGRGKKLIQIIEHMPLGPKKSIFLIKVAGKNLLIGSTNDKINLISEIREDVTPNEVTHKEVTPNDIVKGGNKENFINLMKKTYLENKQR